MLKKMLGSEEEVSGKNDENIKKIESNDSLSSSISSISLYSFDSRSNSNEYNSNDNLCNEEYKMLIDYDNAFLIEKLNKNDIPVRQKRRERETQNILTKSPQLSDALKIIEKSKKYYNPFNENKKVRSLSISSYDYFIGDFSESKCE